jgi:hypothetical protein
MAVDPKFTKRAAEEIARREAVRRQHLPPGNYLSFIGWENDWEPEPPPDPIFGYYVFSAAEDVPEQLQVECHGVRLAYIIPDRLLAKLQSFVLDFDGERFVFVKERPG